MRIRDWSSDVCSSDLPGFRRGALPRASLGVRAADVQRQPVGPFRAWLSALISGPAAPAVEKGQPLEPNDVMNLLKKRAAQWRTGLFRARRLQILKRPANVKHHLQPLEPYHSHRLI